MSKLPLHRWESRTGVVDDDFAKKARVRKGSVFTVTDTGVGALVVEVEVGVDTKGFTFIFFSSLVAFLLAPNLHMTSCLNQLLDWYVCALAFVVQIGRV